MISGRNTTKAGEVKNWFVTPPKIGKREDDVVTGALLLCCFLKVRKAP